MKYISMIYENSSELVDLSEREYEDLLQQHKKLQQLSKENETYNSANQLAPADKAVSVRIRNKQTIVTDGPFSETKELFVGYYVFECTDLDRAIHWAKMIPTRTSSGVEIRPIDNTSCADSENHTPKQNFSLHAEMTLYSLLIYQTETIIDAHSPNQLKELIQGNNAFVKRAYAAGEYVTGAKLMPPVTATSIRHTDTPHQITDGPFSEAKEVLLGQHIVACKSFDDAIEYATSIPDASTGVIEVRPIKMYEQIGEESLEWINSA